MSRQIDPDLVRAKALAVDDIDKEKLNEKNIVFISQPAAHLSEREFDSLNSAILDMDTRGQPLYSRLEKWYVTQKNRWLIQAYDQNQRHEMLSNLREGALLEKAQKEEEEEKKLYLKLRKKYEPNNDTPI